MKLEIVVCKLFSIWMSLKFVVWERVKVFADDKLIAPQVMIIFFDFEEKTVGKEENDGEQHFLLFTLSKVPFPWDAKRQNCLVKG